VYAGIVILADTISAVRPGAHAESMTNYLQRLERLEKLAMSIEGVQQAFAIQAGREIRVVVTPDQIDDARSQQLAEEIARRVENELQYPGRIKVVVIRETRAVDIAR
jgi:ribonuclease Y